MSKHNGEDETKIVIGEHFYQPSRTASHIRLKQLRTSVRDWNRIIANECYKPQSRSGVLDDVSFDVFATLRHDLLEIAPKESVALRQSMRARGVGDPFLHVLLPDLNIQDKDILVKAGWHSFKKDTSGVPPQWFWAPETALDNATLEVLANLGYVGVICAPEQIAGVSGAVDNYPVRLKLGNGAQILALPFDRPLSSQLAFDDKVNADDFAARVIAPRIQKLPKSVPIVGWTDGETFGHHSKNGDVFLSWLITNSLPDIGVTVLGLNDIQDVWEKKDYRQGQLRERTAWSCPHGNLVRWHGECGCDGGFHGGWKKNFSEAVAELNSQIDIIISKQLDGEWRNTLAEKFEDAFYFKGEVRNNQQSLLAAKASALGALISCGTFFDDPGTSGTINMLFARQAFEHLIDAGFGREVKIMQKQFQKKLSLGTDPHTRKNLAEFFVYYFD